MKFLDNMRVLHKILIIVAIMLMPVGYLLNQVIEASDTQINFSKLESEGVDFILQVRDIQMELAKGRMGELQKKDDPFSKVDDALSAVKKTTQTSALLSSDSIRAYEDAKTTEFKLDSVVGLIGEIADKSNLTLDPDIDTFYTQDSVTVKIPNRVMEMSDVHAILTEVVETGVLSPEQRTALNIKQVLQQSFTDGIDVNKDKSFAGNTDGSLKPALEIYYKQADDKADAMLELVTLVLEKGDAKEFTREKLDTTYEEFLKSNQVLWEKASAELNRMLDKRIHGLEAKKMQSITIALIMIAFGLLAGWFMTTSITRPISNLVNVMNRLAKGELDLEVPGQDRKEEIGDIARAVVGISESVAEKARRDAAAVEAARMKEEEAKRLAEEQRRQEAEQMEHMAEVERKKAMNEMADRFESSVGSVVDTVSSAATELRSSAESMAHISNQTTDRATAVAAATEEATASVQTVASASEQLLSSINEISQKVDESAGFTRQAVGRAQATNTTVEGLAESAKKIDNVVKMIQDIAWQTNLLALNATIEAARAGDAGKGFAVVAAEVKNLADQTSKATVEISEQIANMQTNTQDAVKAIKDISGQIAQINQISESIAAAVEEQSASTKEIALNVRQASTGTQEVAKNIVEVSRASSESGEAAAQVLGASSELSKKSEQLRGLVEEFIAQIRG